MQTLDSQPGNPPAPPSPPPPRPEPPPPPSPPPPPDLESCQCYCTESANRNEDDWSPLALEAYSEPFQNTRLYAAYASVERGAEERPVAHIYVEGASQALVRYVESPALSLPMAHVTNNWRLDSNLAALTKSYAPVLAMPAAFINACPSQLDWAVQAQEPDDGFCASTNFKAKCLVSLDEDCGPWSVDGDATLGCHQFYCQAWDANPGAPQCLATDQSLCDMCKACFENSGAVVFNTSNSAGAPYADAWRLLPDASTDRTDWFSRCSAECAEQTTMFLLHYVQYNSLTGLCECFTSDTPEPPDNAEMTHFIAENGVYDASGNTNIWSVGPPRYDGVFEGELGGTLYYAQAFEQGIIMPVHQTDSGESHTTPSDCGNRCVHVLGKDAIAGFVLDPIQRTCECIGDPNNNRDPLALQNRAQVLLAGVDSTAVMYKAFWCEGAEPDPRSDGAYVYSKRVGSQTWCPGKVPTNMGEAVINGSKRFGIELNPCYPAILVSQLRTYTRRFSQSMVHHR